MRRGLRIMLLGVSALAVASVVWRLDFGLGMGPAPFLTQIGVLFIVIGVVDATVPVRFYSRPFLLFGVVLGGTFLVLLSALYIDLVVLSARYSPLRLETVVLNRLSFTLLLGSSGMGYVAALQKRLGASVRTPILGALLLWVGSFGITYAQGIATHGGLAFTTILYLLYLPAIMIAGAAIYAICTRTTA